jgi:tRNA uridine 5-carbamoylmethylation protein Kti12
MNVYILCGLPGSGKSTWSQKKVKEEDAIIISNDCFRSMLTGSYLYNEKYERLIYESSYFVLVSALKMGFGVIYDEINITKLDRAEVISVIESLQPHCKIICVRFKDRDDCLDRRMQDSRGISRERWSVIISEMKGKFEEPDLSERFDQIVIV